MRNYLIAERYARGLSKAVADNAELETLVAALNRLSGIYAENHDLRNVLANPSIDAEKRLRVLREVLDREEAPPLVQGLAQVLLRRGRIAVLPDVAEVFTGIADERLGRIGAEVTTAIALEDQQRSRLRRLLEQFSGKTVRMNCEVDPAIYGGAVARVGGTVIDGSVRTRLEHLRQTLLSEEL